jgi:hypothetical protein
VRGADQQFPVAAALGELVTAVLADVVKRLDFALARMRDDDILVVNLEREKIPGFTDLA